MKIPLSSGTIRIVWTPSILLAIISARNVKKRRGELQEVHTDLKIGSQVMFAGGIYGKVVGIEDETVNVEVAKGTVIKISRYAIQSLEN